MHRRVIVTALTLGRLPFVGLGYWATIQRDSLATAVFALTAVATDIADGRLARRWGVQTDWGSQLDSAADFIFYTSLLVWTYLFVPEPLERHLGLITTFFALYAAMLVLNYFFNRSIAVHNRVSRATATVGTLTAIYFIGWGYVEWMLLVATLFGTADIAQRVHSVVQALAVKRRGFEE